MKYWIVWVVIFAGFSCFGELQLGSLFSEGMVLQRNQLIPVWGWSQPEADIVVSFAGQDYATTADKTGAFKVHLKKMSATSAPQTLKVLAGAELMEIKNVLVGEVWLCSGQSNMDWPVSKSMNFGQEKEAATYPHIRMFLLNKAVSKVPLKTGVGSWQVCSPETVGAFSATAYFFGRELHNELDIPIGLIRSSWGGTRIEAWSPVDLLENISSAQEYKNAMDAKVARYDAGAVEETYKKQMNTWVEEGKKKRQPKKPVDPRLLPNYPANLYNAMICPLVPYGIRGIIWYQGESNAVNPISSIHYTELLKKMVGQWRADWNAELPFYAVQLPSFKAPQKEPVEKSNWALIRESFMTVSKEVPQVGMAIVIDSGEARNIHPKNKQVVGYRLAQQALAHTYKTGVVAGGPVYTGMKKVGSSIIVSFDDLGSGLMIKGEGPLKSFAIAGKDKSYVFATAKIVGDTVVVSAPEITDPVSVRYAWANNPAGCNLYNKEGFPASPFRTDN